MKRDPRKYLEDILLAGGAIQEFIDGQTIESYRSSRILQSAMHYNFIIIGEAFSQLSKVDPALAGQIPNRRDVISFRNFIAHNYWKLDDDIVWVTATEYLPPLLEQVEALLAELE